MSDRAWTAVAIGASAKFGVATVQKGVAGYEIDVSRRLTDTWAAAYSEARRANEAAGLSWEDAWQVIESAMAASRAAGLRWGPR